jgi:hypothetical protein
MAPKVAKTSLKCFAYNEIHFPSDKSSFISQTQKLFLPTLENFCRNREGQTFMFIAGKCSSKISTIRLPGLSLHVGLKTFDHCTIKYLNEVGLF